MRVQGLRTHVALLIANCLLFNAQAMSQVLDISAGSNPAQHEFNTWPPTAPQAWLTVSSPKSKPDPWQLGRSLDFHLPYLACLSEDIVVTSEAESSAQRDLKEALQKFRNAWNKAGFEQPTKLGLMRQMWHLPIRHPVKPYLPIIEQENLILSQLATEHAALLKRFRFTVWFRLYGISALLETELQANLQWEPETARKIALAAVDISRQFQTWHSRVLPLIVCQRFEQTLVDEGVSGDRLSPIRRFVDCYSRLFLDPQLDAAGVFIAGAETPSMVYSSKLIDIIGDRRLTHLTQINPELSHRIYIKRREYARARSDALEVLFRDKGKQSEVMRATELEWKQIKELEESVEKVADLSAARIVQMAIRTHIFDVSQLTINPNLLSQVASSKENLTSLSNQFDALTDAAELDLQQLFLTISDQTLVNLLTADQLTSIRGLLTDEYLLFGYFN